LTFNLFKTKSGTRQFRYLSLPKTSTGGDRSCYTGDIWTCSLRLYVQVKYLLTEKKSQVVLLLTNGRSCYACFYFNSLLYLLCYVLLLFVCNMLFYAYSFSVYAFIFYYAVCILRPLYVKLVSFWSFIWTV